MARNRSDNRDKDREPKLPVLIAYHVAERNGKHFWTRIGAAWDHDDAKGITVVLDIIPANSDRIVLREPADDLANNHGEGA